jgi:hypothetical protein
MFTAIRNMMLVHGKSVGSEISAEKLDNEEEFSFDHLLPH